MRDRVVSCALVERQMHGPRAVDRRCGLQLARSVLRAADDDRLVLAHDATALLACSKRTTSASSTRHCLSPTLNALSFPLTIAALIVCGEHCHRLASCRTVKAAGVR